MKDKEKNDLEETTLSVDERLKRYKKEEESEDVEAIEDKEFGLSPDEYEAEIAYQRRPKLPVLEGDAPLTTRDIDLERRNHG